MKCDEMQLNISMYVDDALEAHSQEKMFAHLATCRECRMFLRRTLDLRAAFAAFPSFPSAPAAWARASSAAAVATTRLRGPLVMVPAPSSIERGQGTRFKLLSPSEDTSMKTAQCGGIVQRSTPPSWSGRVCDACDLAF